MNINNKLNILVTGCGGDIGQSIGKILRNATFTKNLFGMDISNKNAAQFIYSNFHVGLRFSDPNYLNSLESFVEENAIDIIIPIAEPELRFFSQKKIFDKIGDAKIIIASPLALEIGFDKFMTAQFLKANDLPFPETSLAGDIDDQNLFPVVLKSRTGSGSKDIHVVKSVDELRFYTRVNKDHYVIQEYLPDTDGEFTCGVFRARNGEIKTQIFKRELTGGYSGYGELVESDTITSLLESLAKKIELIGSINVQLRISDHLPKIFEINPRFSSTVLFRHLFGFTDLIWSIEDSLGYDLSDYVKNEGYSKFYKGFNEYIK